MPIISGEPTYTETVKFFEKGFEDKSNDYLTGYVEAVDSRKFSKVFNLIWMTQNGAKYEAVKNILEERLESKSKQPSIQ